MLELKNITKTFGNVVANNDVSIKVEKGTIHAIVGEERRREIDDHADRLRLLQRRQRRDIGRRQNGFDQESARCDRPRHWHGASAFYAG